MKSANAIAFDYTPSRWPVVAIAAMTVLAFAAIALSGAPTWMQSVGAIIIVVCAGFALRSHLRSPVRRVVWQQAGHWRVTDADGREFTADSIRGVARGSWIVLNLRRSDGRCLDLILGPDNCDADTRRRLRVRMASLRDHTS
jgi:toxin CptA